MDRREHVAFLRTLRDNTEKWATIIAKQHNAIKTTGEKKKTNIYIVCTVTQHGTSENQNDETKYRMMNLS